MAPLTYHPTPFEAHQFEIWTTGGFGRGEARIQVALTFDELITRDIVHSDNVHSDLVRALFNLLEQLEGVGIYIKGQDEGQWAGTEGLSFAEANAALTRVSEGSGRGPVGVCSRCSPGSWTQTPQGCSCPSCPTWCGCECRHKQTGEDAAIEEQEYEERYEERIELIEQQAQKYGAAPAPEGD